MKTFNPCLTAADSAAKRQSRTFDPFKVLFFVVIALIVAFAWLGLSSCTAFTAPVDPETGIRQDAPADWDDTPNPLDAPEVITRTPIAEGRFGHSNKGVTW